MFTTFFLRKPSLSTYGDGGLTSLGHFGRWDTKRIVSIRVTSSKIAKASEGNGATVGADILERNAPI
jgi:hypothetical protein